MTDGPRFPQVEVKLTGLDGNAVVLLAAVEHEMRRYQLPTSKIEQFKNEARSGDYDHLLRTCMRWVTVR